MIRTIEKTWDVYEERRNAHLADNQIMITVPAGELWKIKHIYTSYISSANAGNRWIVFAIDDGKHEDASLNLLSTKTETAITASKVVNVNIAEGLNFRDYSANAQTIDFPLPKNLILEPGSRIWIYSNGTTTGDYFDYLLMFYERFVR